MSTFKAPIDQILFSLSVAGAPQLSDWDAELSADILTHFDLFAQEQIAPLNAIGDTVGARLIDGRVCMPDGFKQAYRAYVAQGWPGLSVPERFGGQAASAAILGGVSEIFTGACHGLQMVAGLVPGAVRVLEKFATPVQQQTYIPMLASGEWLATMCMSEPNAGSDLSAIRTRAVEVDGAWQVSGEKIFISGGDQDLSQGILHLVLAKTDEHESPIRGLSLFLVRSHNEAGAANAVSVLRLERKLGLHASPTCHMVFDGADAEMLGTRGQGLRAMFTLMNHARLDVALQGVAHASRAADIAADYAKNRQQGGKALDQHSDVARMLDQQAALAIGARAMCHIALVALEAGDKTDLVDFLTPVCKTFGSEAGITSADLAIQVLGGYGYLSEYNVEQIWRDARVTAIYEGANGIHAHSLATRMLHVNDGAAANAFAQLIGAGAGKSQTLKTCLDQWQTARKLVANASEPARHAHAFMKLTGALFYLYTWTQIGDRSEASPDHENYARLNQIVQRTIPIEVTYWAGLLSS